MSWGAVAGAAISTIGGALLSDDQSSSAGNAAGAVDQGNAQAIQAQKDALDEYKRQFDVVRGLLSPFVTAGTGALSGQLDLLGTNGVPQQAFAIDQIKNGAAFKGMKQVGEEAILQNASATGGLRGGNVQAALSQFDQNTLAQLIQQQFQNLGGITSMGQNAAAGTGNAAMGVGSAAMGAGNNISALLQNTGQANAAGILGAASGRATGINSAVNAAGVLAGRIPGIIGGSGGGGTTTTGSSGLVPYTGGGWVDAGAGGYT